MVRREEAPSASLPRGFVLRWRRAWYCRWRLPLPDQGALCLRRASLHSPCGSASSTASGRGAARVARACVCVRAREVSCCRGAIAVTRSDSGQERFRPSASRRDDRRPASGCPLMLADARDDADPECFLCAGEGTLGCSCPECWGSMRRSRHPLVPCDCRYDDFTTRPPPTLPPEPAGPPSSPDTGAPSR